RGHSLARSMFGYNSTTGVINNVPSNGVGRIMSNTIPPQFVAAAPPPTIGGEILNDRHLINYMAFRDGTGALVDGMLHDPERPGWRADAAPQLAWVGGFNVPYTYPDLNNMFLAAVRADGTVLPPSFHRPWLFGALNDIPNQPPGNPGNPNWTSP